MENGIDFDAHFARSFYTPLTVMYACNNEVKNNTVNGSRYNYAIITHEKQQQRTRVVNDERK